MQCDECYLEAVYLILKGRCRGDKLCEICLDKWIKDEMEGKYRRLEE